jgi:hypothetical protein
MAKIYVASSWRNAIQPFVVTSLREEGHLVYDFRNPAPGDSGFSWASIDPYWRDWSASQYLDALNHKRAVDGYAHDIGAMQWADTCVLVLPCGRSAHLELGWMAGSGKRTIILTRDGEEPELMAKMATKICTSLDQVLAFLRPVN